MTRTQLPNRRHGLTVPVEHRNQKFDCTFSFDESGHVREAFMRSTKEGNDFSALMVDGCIAISMLLQHGQTCESLVKAFGNNRLEGETDDHPQSALGAIARVGADLDARVLKLVGETAADPSPPTGPSVS
jgi:hypothetical protein